jgi:predicted RNase H-like nuclease
MLERMNLIRDKLPGVEEMVTRQPPPGAGQIHMLQATGLLWTARRAAGRAMNRLPRDPGWDSAGMRMELVR